MESVKFQLLTNVCIQMCVLGGRGGEGGAKKPSDKLGKDKHSRSCVSCWLDHTTHLQLGVGMEPSPPG